MTQVIRVFGQARWMVRTSGTTWVASPNADKRNRARCSGGSMKLKLVHSAGVVGARAMQNAHIPTLDVQRAAFAQGAILFDRHSLPQATPRMLDPTFWAGSNALEGRGGRGSAWLVHGRFGDAVLRHYRRGGLVGRWVDDRYLFLGEASVRCVREFQLLARLYERGLPVPRPLLAG